MKILSDGKALLIGLEKLDTDVLDSLPNLKVIGCNMTGTDHLPIEEIERRGIKLISLEGETEFLKEIRSTAEHTIGLIIALLRNYKTALNGPYKNREEYKGHTLRGKILGVIGYGRVGQQVAEIGARFGTKLAFVDYDYGSLRIEGVLEYSDIVSLHIPLQGNEGFFTRDMFQQMKPTSYFVNTSRSGVVEKGALKWALENKVIAGAAVDFTDDQELVHYARDHDNLILTNHIGGCTEEDMARTEGFITRKIEEYLVENKIIQ